jgi:hypothetical protein
MSTALQLSGNNFVAEALSNLGSKGLGDFTLQAWLKTNASGPVFYYRPSKGNGYFAVEINGLGQVDFFAQVKGEVSGLRTVRGGINNGEWYFVSLVKAGTQLTLAVNGKPVAARSISVGALPATVTEEVWMGKGVSNNGKERFFNGELGTVAIWGRALCAEEIVRHQQTPINGSEEGLLLFTGKAAPRTTGKKGVLGTTVGNLVPMPEQYARITIVNDSPFKLGRSVYSGGQAAAQFPKEIPANSTVTFVLSDASNPAFLAKAIYSCSANSKAGLEIEVNKSRTYYKSYLKAQVSSVLERDIKTNLSNAVVFDAVLQVSENLVIVNAKNLNLFVKQLHAKRPRLEILMGVNYNEKTEKAESNVDQLIAYNEACQLFNRRIQEKPAAIVFCRDKYDVQATYQTAIANNLPVSVRSGGHDHEGESSGTNTILIDMMGLGSFDLVGKEGEKVAVVGPGNRFIVLTTKLAELGVMIPHGTCATVAIPGYIMGGGWGPWTRKMGMCCEHLVGAEIVLANGNIVEANEKTNPELLWALKGGGGMSYGIVTEFRIQTFPLPPLLIKFELEWNPYDRVTQEIQASYPTIKVLKAWENAIFSNATPRLNGTNLKINGKNLAIVGYTNGNLNAPIYEQFDPGKVVHNCVMYGYWEGTQSELDVFIEKSFTSEGVRPNEVRIDGTGGIGSDYADGLMASWDRESFHNVKMMAQMEKGSPLPPDLDEPAPHKITSRLVEKSWKENDEGRNALLKSLTSPLILPGNRLEGLFTYVTLGAIDGDYYQHLSEAKKKKSAFPYKDRLYTIQYQTWWNTELKLKEELQDNKVYTRTNRALDWMEVSRDFKIPHTSGAFISFKDSSIPTETYFGDSYVELKRIKEKYGDDTYNHLRSRKTII